MREIKFRGKDIDQNKWRYGSYVKMAEKDGTILEYIEEVDGQVWIVLPETVGQYTGLKDKNGTKIYEGDIIKFTRLAGNPTTGTYSLTDICVIKWIDWSCSFRLCYGTQEQKILNRYEYEVIGNTYENPELR